MTKHWRDCIVTVIDIIGIKKAARAGGSKASRMMMKLHSLTRTSMNCGMPLHEHVYCWNDSVLLLAYWDGKSKSGHDILREASELKRSIDEKIGKTYAVSVKGRTFPDQVQLEPEWQETGHHPRCVVLRASSYAMANCCLIEAKAKKLKLRADWYVDSRLKQTLNRTFGNPFPVELLPKDTRRVLPFDGYIT